MSVPNHVTTLCHIVDVRKAVIRQIKETFTFNVENMMMDFEIKQYKKSVNEYSGYITMRYYDNIESVDDRLVEITLQCGNITRQMNNSIRHFHSKSGWGFHQLFTSHILQNANYKIKIKIIIESDGYCSEHQLPSMHKQQLKILDELNNLKGDLLLIPKELESNQKNEETKNDDVIHIEMSDHENENEEFKHSDIDTTAGIDGDENITNYNNQNGVKTSSLLLMSSSNVFKAMLTSQMKEANDKVIKIACKSIKVIDDLVYFITTGYLRDNINIIQLLKLSHLYELKALNYACLDRLIIRLNGRNLANTINAFERYKFDDKITLKIYTKLVKKFKANQMKYLSTVNIETIPMSWLAWTEYV